MQLNIYNQSKAIIFALTYQKFNVEAFRILSRFQNLVNSFTHRDNGN